MLKKRIFIIVLIFIVALNFLIAASTATTKIKTDSFVLEFQKPPHNKFFFSDPDDTTKEFNLAKGVVFSFVNLNDADKGYPSSAMFAITYEFESTGTFEVFANANIDHSSNFRIYAKDANAGLNYKIERYATKPAESGDSVAENTIEADVLASEAIYSVNIATPMENEVSKVFKLSLISNQLPSGSYDPYVEGQYQGYLIMEFTPSI